MKDFATYTLLLQKALNWFCILSIPTGFVFGRGWEEGGGGGAGISFFGIDLSCCNSLVSLSISSFCLLEQRVGRVSAFFKEAPPLAH